MSRDRILAGIGLLVVAALLLVVFRMYLNPDMVLEFSNLIFCT